MKNLNMLAILQEHDLLEYGHFCLSSGLHSHLYIRACDIMRHPHMALKTAKAMADLFSKTIDIVVSPSERTFIIAEKVASARGARASYAKDCEKGKLTLKKNFIIKPEENVLIVDDVAVTGKQIEYAVNLIKKTGAKVIGVAVIVDRSSGYAPLNVPLRALVSYPLRSYHKADCPLCKSNIPLSEDMNDD